MIFERITMIAVLRKDWRNKGRSSETSLMTVAIIQTSNDGLDQMLRIDIVSLQ